jgi:hypothetical protein
MRKLKLEVDLLCVETFKVDELHEFYGGTVEGAEFTHGASDCVQSANNMCLPQPLTRNGTCRF